MKKRMKRIFLTGLAVVIPAGLTIYILSFIMGIMDSLLQVIPTQYQPDNLLHVHIPGLGAIVTVILIFVCGLVTKSYLGNRLVRFGEHLVGKIPFVRSVYQAIKRIADSLFMDKAQSFKSVVMVEYPRRGVYGIGFVTGTPNEEIQNIIGQKSPCVGVFMPLALTPTTGFFIMVPRDELIELCMTVEEAFTLIISAGIVTPNENFAIAQREQPPVREQPQ
ncbi:MAG: hypothetical protein CO013_14515 [Syntrophobacterales bacterium CG_4_8_14_3_um_filter_58_8]|nr:MAG: hypothetical protein COS57_11800 [Syntrophobacterales bacterium CG03_land_8_20_14_0_80_58_14]PJC71456.1 MAG: hypothetical protein CO013_14515 [Syntrophobacterales bacterium CG_4_8_14_3_um_filter_58_8]